MAFERLGLHLSKRRRDPFLVADADKVAFRWTFNGTHRGPLADIRASGKQVSVSNNVGIFQIADGKVNESRLCWDKYALLQQVGALPPSS